MNHRVRYILVSIFLIWLGGCVDSASGPVETVSFTGGWSGARNGCEQRLVLEEGGGFTLSARIDHAGSTKLEWISGQYTQMDGAGLPRLKFFPDGGVNPRAILYYDQWLSRGELGLGFAAITSQTGISPDTLELRTEISAALGGVTVGTDTAQADRYASFQNTDGGILQIVLTNPVAHPLYRTNFADANHEVSTVGGRTVVNLPQGAWQSTLAPAAVARLVLNMASASEVTFSAVAGSGLPPCNYAIYADPTFGTVVSSFTFASGQQSHSVQFNPGDPGAFFYTATVTLSGASATAYFIPISFSAPAGGSCAIRIRGRSLVLAVLEALQQQNHPALVNFPAPGPEPYTVRHLASAPSTLLLGPMPPGLVPAESHSHSAIVSWLPLSVGADGSAPIYDQIDLLNMNSEALTVSIEERGQQAYLSLFPEGDAVAAFGPLSAIPDNAGATVLAFPSTTSLQFASDQQVLYYRFSLNAPGRVAIWTEGGLALAGELYSASGRDITRNRGGAPDRAGFQIVRQLPAAAYEIVVRRLGASGAFTLKIDSPGSFPFADDALGECLIEAEWAAGVSITNLNCAGRGISSLAGLESVTSLQRLALGRNRLTDISTLQFLSSLREISLDDNQVADLSSLAGLTLIERLGLGGNPLNAGAPAVLGGLTSLSHLDLRGVATLTLAEATSLKQTLAATLIVAPDGTVLD